jgi:uncharacterized membrane protein HdeD (DUF308 family)
MTFLRGAIWMLFGILIFMQPGLSLVMFTYLFGMFALIDGIASMVRARRFTDRLARVRG